MKSQFTPQLHTQQGLTLVELMVAMVIGIIVVMAATAALLLSRQGFSQVDAASQLRDNARYAEELIQRLALQAGYRDITYAATTRPPSTDGLSEEKPNVFGFNNFARSSSSSSKSDEASSTERSTSEVGYGSDILVLRFQSAASEAGTGSDKAIIDCAGLSPSGTMKDRYYRFSSVFHIGTDSRGEPSLMCTRWSAPNDGSNADTQPLIAGVENFQVLYGIDKKGNEEGGVVSDPDSVTEQYVRADQLTVAGDEKQTLTNWQQVRSLRIGLVLRAAPGTAIGDTSTTTLYPLGSGVAKDMFTSTNDPGTTFTPPNDGRLRQVATFTVHLRNPQGDD